MVDLRVKKKDGRVEDFRREKLVTSLERAGMKSKENVEKV